MTTRKSARYLHFTKRTIDALPLPATGRDRYYDADLSGLGIRVYPSGKVTWFLLTRHRGESLRLTLGVYRRAAGAAVILSPEKARTLATATGEKVAAGIVPGARQQAAAETLTLAEVYKHYCLHHVVRSEKARAYEWASLAKFKNKRLDSIAKDDVRVWFRARAEKTSPSTANKSIARLRALYAWARNEMDYTGVDPSAGIRKYNEDAAIRRRRLKLDELPRFFAALDSGVVSQTFADIFRLALYTGQRSGNVCSMRFDQIDFAGNLWAIPHTKQGRAIEVSLAPQAIEILERRRAELRSGFVFPSRGRKGHVVTTRKAWLAVCEASQISGLRVHDLRRSLASFSADMGISTAIISAQLGHAPGGQTTAKHYLEFSGKARAEAIAAVVESLLAAGGDDVT